MSLLMNKVLWECSHTFLSCKMSLWLFCGKTAVSSWVVTTETVHPTKPKLFAIRPCAEKVCQPLFWIILSNVYNGVKKELVDLLIREESIECLKEKETWKQGRKERQRPTRKCQVSGFCTPGWQKSPLSTLSLCGFSQMVDISGADISYFT